MCILFLCLLYYWANLDFNILFFQLLSVCCLYLTALGTMGYRSKVHIPHPQYIDSLRSHDRLKEASSNFVTKLWSIAT